MRVRMRRATAKGGPGPQRGPTPSAMVGARPASSRGYARHGVCLLSTAMRMRAFIALALALAGCGGGGGGGGDDVGDDIAGPPDAPAGFTVRDRARQLAEDLRGSGNFMI